MKKNRRSVIVDETKYNNNSRHSKKDKTKSRIYDAQIKDEDYNKSKISKISKKERKTLMKDAQGYPNELSSQRTDKNLLLKQNKGRKSFEKTEKETKKDKSKKDLNIIETTGINEEEKKNGDNSISSWEEDSAEEINSEDVKKEVNKKWYRAYYLTNLAMKLNHAENAVKYCDEMIKLCDEPLNTDQIKIILAANSLYINQLRKSQRGLVKLLMEEKEAKNLIYEIKANKEKAIIERSEKFIKLINDDILPKNNLSNEHHALFLKTKADYYRYLAEVTHDHDLFINKQNALHFYMEAKNLTRNLDNLNAIKLDIALNYSVFLNEIMNKRINSYFAAKEAVFNALSDLKNCTEAELAAEEMRDSLICIEILNRNVEEWYNEEMEADNEEAERKKKELIEKENEKNKYEGDKTKRGEEEENIIKNEEDNLNDILNDIENREKEKDALIDNDDFKEDEK